MDEKWLESLSQLYDNRPDISDDEVFRIIPELNGDRKKLEAAQGYYYMKKNGYTDAKIKSTLPELFPAQAKQPTLNDMKAQMAQKFSTKPVSDSPNPNAQIQTNATATLKEQGDKPFPTVTEKHQQEALAAQKRVQDELLNSNGVVKNIISKSKADQYQAGVRDNLTDIPNAAAQHLQQVDPKVLAPDTKVSDEEVQQYQQNMNPEQEREVLNHVAQQNPEKQKQLEHDMYLLDATARGGDSQKVLKNAEKIKSGDYDYSIWKGGSVQKPEGFFSSLANGFKQRQKLLEDYDTFNNTDNDGAVISQLEADRNQAPPDPDEPVPTPKGLGGTLGGITGSEGIATAKSLGAGALTNLIPGVGEVLSPWVAAAASSPEYYKRAYAGTLRQVYNEERDKGMPEFDALQKARSQAKVDAELSAAQGAAMTVTGMRLGAKPIELNLSPGFINTVKGVAKGAGKFLTQGAPEGFANSTLAAGLEVGKNIHAQSIGLDRETDQGATDVFGQNLAFHYGLGALTKLGGAAVSGINKKRILTEVAKQPDEVIKQNLGEMVQDGNITPDDATDVQQQVNDMRKLDGMIPDKVVNQEVRIKLQDKIAKRDALEEEMKGLHKSLQKPLKERIAAMDEDIVSLANSDEAKIESKEDKPAEVSDVQDVSKEPQTINEETKINEKDTENNPKQTSDGDRVLSGDKEAVAVDESSSEGSRPDNTIKNDTANAQDGSNDTAGESTDTAGRVPEENAGSADRVNEPLPAGDEQHDQSGELTADLHKFLAEDDGLPQVHKDAGAPEPVSVKEQPHEYAKYGDTSTVLSEAKEHFKDHPLIQRVIKFLEPILADNPHIRIDPSKPLDSKYDGMQYPDGSIAINFKNFSNKGDMYRTMLHEMMHGVTRNEIVKNVAFRDELSDVLTTIREKMGLPDNDGLLRALYENNKIHRDLNGITNPHELLAEVFTDQKFHDYLKGIKYEGTNLLERLFLKIAKWFSEKYKAIADVKEHTSAEDIAHYLMDLTEHVVKKGKIGTAGPDELAKASGLQVNKAVKWVADKLKAGVDEAQIHSALQSTLQISPDIATNIIENAKLRPETASIDRKATPSGETITDRDIQAVLGSKSKISVGSAVMKTMRRIFDKNFTSTGGLPEMWLSIKEFATGGRKLAARQMKGLILDLHEAVKKTGFTDYKKISEALANEPNVANNPALAALPNELQQVVIGMRNMVDGYSQSLISEGLIEPSKALILEDHLGEYLNRSYQLYTDKNWPDKVPPQVREDAVRFLSQQNLESILEQNPNMPVDVAMKHAIQLADTQVKDYLTLKKTPTGQRYSEQISKDLSALKKREDIPAPIRKLMGEYEDPATQFAVTISKLATLHSQGKMLKTLREQFKGVLFFEKNEPRPDGFNHEVSATGSEAWSPLNGLYTNKAVIDELQAQQTQWTPALAWYRKAFGYVKAAKTVYSIPTQAVNFGANPLISVANGHFNFTKLGDAWKYYKDEMFHDGTSQDALIETLVQHNVIGQSLDLRSLRHNLQRDNADIFNIEESIKNPSTMKNPINWVKGLDKVAQKQYGASDSFWKVYGFSNEATSWSHALYDKKYSALNPTEKAHIDQLAAERIKNTYPTYDRALKGLLWAQNNIPGIGNFMAFQAEVLRTTKNNFLYALKDMHDPNPKVKLIGAKRMAGIISYSGLKIGLNYLVATGSAAGVSSLWSAALGDDDNKKKKRIDLDRYTQDFLRTHNLIVEDKGDGVYSVRDIDRLDPYNMMWQAMNAGFTGLKKEGGGVGSAVKGAATEVMEPFIEPDMIVGGLLQINKNQDSQGRPIYNKAASEEEQYNDMMDFMWKVIEPTTVKLGKRMDTVAIEDYKKTKDKGSAVKAAVSEFGKSLVGMRAYNTNVKGVFVAKMEIAEEKLGNNKQFFYNDNYKNDDKMPQELKDKYNDNARRVFKELHEDYNAAIRLGANGKELLEKIDKKFKFYHAKANIVNAITKGGDLEKIDLYEK